MEFPRSHAVRLGGLLPPAVGDNNVDSTVAVDVAVTEAVGKLARARNLFPLLTGLANRKFFPGLGGIIARQEITHLALIVFAWRLPAHDEDFFAISEKINVNRCFVASAGGKQMGR